MFVKLETQLPLANILYYCNSINHFLSKNIHLYIYIYIESAIMVSRKIYLIHDISLKYP